MSDTPVAAESSRKAAETSSACLRDSIWHGPAIKTNGRLLAIATSPTCTVRRSVVCIGSHPYLWRREYDLAMPTLLIRNIDPTLYARLKRRAAKHRRSLED